MNHVFQFSAKNLNSSIKEQLPTCTENNVAPFSQIRSLVIYFLYSPFELTIQIKCNELKNSTIKLIDFDRSQVLDIKHLTVKKFRHVTVSANSPLTQ